MVVLGTGTTIFEIYEAMIQGILEYEVCLKHSLHSLSSLSVQPVVQNVDRRVNTLVQLREYGSQQAQTAYTGRLSRSTSKRYAFYKSGSPRSLSSI